MENFNIIQLNILLENSFSMRVCGYVNYGKKEYHLSDTDD